MMMIMAMKKRRESVWGAFWLFVMGMETAIWNRDIN
jgi:hypothetical protein